MQVEDTGPRVDEPAEFANDPLAAQIEQAWEASAKEAPPVEEAADDTPDSAPVEASDDAATETDADAADDTPAVAEPEAIQPLDAPARWSEADKAKFAAWPRDVQEAVIGRHKAMEADYTRKTQEIAEYRKQADPLVEAVKPHHEYLSEVSRHIGIPVGAMIGQIVQAERVLRTGQPNDKVNALLSLAQSYGIDLANLAQGGTGQPDPLITDMRQQLMRTQQQLAEISRASEQSQKAQLSETITAFASATDQSGRPKHPHFERVKVVMGSILERGEAATLEEAYSKAVEPIQAAIAEELKLRQAEADQKRKAAVDKARKAAPVRSSGASPNGRATSTDLDSLLSQQLSAHYGA